MDDWVPSFRGACRPPSRSLRTARTGALSGAAAARVSALVQLLAAQVVIDLPRALVRVRLLIEEGPFLPRGPVLLSLQSLGLLSLHQSRPAGWGTNMTGRVCCLLTDLWACLQVIDGGLLCCARCRCPGGAHPTLFQA